MDTAPTNVNDKDRARDKRYRKTYRISLDTYNKIGDAQSWRCGGCGKHADEFKISMNVDHEHFTITLVRDELTDGWIADTYIRFRNARLSRWGKTQKAARAALKDIALPLSIRGLLCPGRYKGCNRRMGRLDDPIIMRNLATYLENPPAMQIMGII
jgi:hypothetical protein